MGDIKCIHVSLDNKIFVVFSDNKKVEVTNALRDLLESLRLESTVVKNWIEHTQTIGLELFFNSSTALAKVLRYSQYHREAQKTSSDGKPRFSKEQIEQWDADFMKVDEELLFDLVSVAYRLDMKNLLELGTNTYVDKVSSSLDKIQRVFGIESDLETGLNLVKRLARRKLVREELARSTKRLTLRSSL